MTDAPEKIWAWRTADRIVGELPVWAEMGFAADLPGHAYTRTDLAKAAERAAYLRGLEDAAKVAESKYETLPSNCMCKYGRKKGESCAEWTSRNAAVSIRALAKEAVE